MMAAGSEGLIPATSTDLGDSEKEGAIKSPEAAMYVKADAPPRKADSDMQMQHIQMTSNQHDCDMSKQRLFGTNETTTGMKKKRRSNYNRAQKALDSDESTGSTKSGSEVPEDPVTKKARLLDFDEGKDKDKD